VKAKYNVTAKSVPTDHAGTKQSLGVSPTVGIQPNSRRPGLLFLALAILLASVFGMQAQTVRRVSSPGKFYVDDKASAGIVYNYAVYAISNNTSSNIVSAYVALTNLVATNMIKLASTDSGVRALGALAPGQTKLAAFYLQGPSFTGNSDTILNANEPHTIQVRTAPPSFGTTLTSENFSFTNIIYVIEALANKVTIITNLNPLAVLGSEVDLVIGGETGTIGGNNSVSFSPGVLGSWRPDAYELVKTIVRFDEDGNFTNQMYFDPTVSGFTNFTGQAYTNTFTFRAVKVTGTNLPVSPFAFVDSGSGTKHTAVSTLTSGGGSNLIYSATNAVRILSQTVSPTSLFAPGGTVTYTVIFTNQSTSPLNLDEIRDTLPGVPGAVTYIPGSATYNGSAISDPGISGQLLLWSQPFALPGGSSGTLVFQALAPVEDGPYTNSVIGILGNDQIDTTIITTDGSPSTSVFTVIPVSDVAVSKSAPASVYSGANFNYTITLTNLGPSYARNFSVTDSLPANVTFVSASPAGAFTNGSQVIWTNLGPILAGTSTNIIITVTPPVMAATLTNSATGGSPVLDPDLTNNTAPPVFTTVSPASDLLITKTPSTVSVLPGANVTYTITVTNLGASLASSVVVTDALPANVTFVSATGGGVLSGNNVIWSGLGSIAAGSGTSVSLTVTAPLSGSVSNLATVSSPTHDPNSTNNFTPPIVTLVSNLPPSLVNDIVGTPRNIAVVVPVLANDADPNGSPLTLVSVTQTNGTASITSGTNVTYTPSTNFLGTTVLTYRVTDGQGATNFALITINVTNRPPVAVNDSTLGTNSVPQVINPLVNDSDPDGDSLTISNVVATGGIVTINPGATNLTYTPTNSFSSAITYTVADGFGGTATAVISVIGNNVAPVANNQSVTVPEDTSTNLVVSATDIDNPGLLYAILVGPTHGTLGALNTNTGAVTYSPSNNYHGPDVFTFIAFDGSLYATGTVSITVSPVNDPPVVANDTLTTTEDNTNTIPVLANDSDIDGDTLTVASVVTTNGTATISGTNVIYTPSADFFGTNVMTYCVTDGTVTNCALITVVVNPVNDAPLADNQGVTMNEDSSTNLVLTASDVDNTNLTFSIVTGPANGALGTLNTNSGAISYTPTANFNGADSFTFRAFDGSLYATGTVSITVLPLNDAPVATNLSLTINEDTATNLVLTASDVDNTNLVFAILASPLNGGLTGFNTNSGAATYTPGANYNGGDAFTFTVFDGALYATGTVSITVLPLNDPPAVVDDSVTTTEDSTNTIPVLANDSDADGDSLTIVSITSTNGSATIVGTNVVYVPSPDFFGTNVMTYCATDGTVTNCALITVVVNAVNDAPLAFSQSVTNNEDTALPITLTGSDVDGPVTNFVVATLPLHGSLFGSGANLTYTPTNNYFGPDSFTFTVNDGSLTSAVATVSITVLPVNDAPVANNDSYTTPKNVTLNVSAPGVLGNDADAETNALTAALVANVTHGTLNLSTNGGFTYTPSNNYVGPDSFSYRASDGLSNSAIATVSLTITATNLAPVVVSDSSTVNEDGTNSIPVLVNDSDPDADPITIVSVITTNGTATISGTNIIYTPLPNFFGTNVMTYCATDGALTNCALITVAVLPVNDAPLANNQSVTIPEGTITNLVLTASDVDNTNLTFSILTGPANGLLGTVNTNSGAVTYTPTANYSGSDSFTFRVFDGSLYATGSVSITVTPVNDAPLAFSQSVTNLEDTALPIILTGSDVDGPVTNFVVGTLPLHGTLSGSGANLTYTPTNNYFGPDSFTFTVNDGSLTSSVATVSITVLPVNDPPVAVNDNIMINEDTTNSIPVLVNDSDPDGNPLTIVSVASTNGSATVSGTNVVYVPAPNFFGTNVINYCISDGFVTNCATITVAVLPVNDAPVANNLNLIINVNTTTNLVLTSSDVDGAAPAYSILSGPGNGSLGPLNTNSGAVTYTPNVNYSGVDAFTFRVFDGGLYATGTVSITVLSAQFGVRQGTNVFNPQTGLYEQLVTVTNAPGNPTVPAFQVLVGDIRGTNGIARTNVWLWNYTGTNVDGRRYVQYNSPLDPGSNATVRLEFYNPLRTPFTNSIEIVATLPAAAVTNLSGGVVVDRTFWDYRTAGDSRLVIEWTSIIGRNYTVIYGPWTAATPTVTATATRVQWYDDGPPKTQSQPLVSGSRYYRVILNNP
jgi:uncharacterized repeat protein (TIGR01451 family)